LPGARVVGLVAAWFLRALPPVRRRGSSPGSPGAAHHPPPTPRISSPVPATQPPQRPAGQPPATQRNRAHASTQPRHPRQRSTPPATANSTIFRQRPKPTSHKRPPADGHQAPSPPDSGPANPHQETGRTVGMAPQRTSRIYANRVRRCSHPAATPRLALGRANGARCVAMADASRAELAPAVHRHSPVSSWRGWVRGDR